MPTPRKLSQLASGSLLTAVVGATCMLAACESALRPDAADRGGYSASLVARAVTDPQFLNQAVVPTANMGVREVGRVGAIDPSGNVDLARIDNPGTGAIIPGETPPPPSTQPLLGDEARRYNESVGVGSSQLGAPEGQVRLSLQDAIARAMRHNLDIKVEAYNPAIREAQLVEALAIFDPVAFGNHQFTNTDPFNRTGTTSPTSNQRGQVFTNQLGVRELLPHGGTVQAFTGLNYFDINSNQMFGSNGSGWNPNIGINLTQPLLRGFGSNITNANIYLAQRDRRISQAQFRRRVIQTVGDIEESYHNLVLAHHAVQIQEQLLTFTQDTYQRVVARGQIDAEKVALSQSEAAVEQRRAELIRARASYRSASDRVKASLNDPELDLRGNGLIVPTDRPINQPMIYNVAEQIDIALRQRTELQEARLQVERADIVVDVARNELLPKADITLGATSSGNVEDDLTKAFYSTFNAPRWIDYNVGGKWEFSIGTRAESARYNRRKNERRQALTNLVNQAQKVVLDVKLQLREVLTTYEEIGARQRARAAAGRELDALNSQEVLKPLTPEFLRLKLDAQQRLANAEINEIQSLVNYNVAIARLEQAKGTLLEFNNIAVNVAPPEEDQQKFWFLGNTFKGSALEWRNPFGR